MKTVRLKSLTLKNYRGIQDLTIDANGQSAYIYGRNRAGKSTVYDAYLELITGKDSLNRTAYNIKPTDHNGAPIFGIETSISGVFIVNGFDKEIKRTYKEKYTTVIETGERKYDGLSTYYEIDGRSIKTGKEFQQTITEVFGSDEVFKLLSNPHYFSGTLHWKERRNLLMQIANVSDDEVVSKFKSSPELLDGIRKYETIDNYKKKLADDRLSSEKELSAIQVRIDENKSKIKADIDFNNLRIQKENIEAQIKEIDVLLSSDSESEQQKEKELSELKLKLIKINSEIAGIKTKTELDVDKRIKDSQQEYENLVSQKSSIDKVIGELQKDEKRKTDKLALLRAEVENLRKSWTENNGKTAKSLKEFSGTFQTVELPDTFEEFIEILTKFSSESTFVLQSIVSDDNASYLPTVRDAFVQSINLIDSYLGTEGKKKEYEDYLKRFNEAKTKKLAEIKTEADNLKIEIERLGVDIDEIKKQISENSQKLADLSGEMLLSYDDILKDQDKDKYVSIQLSKDTKYQQLKSEKTAIEKQISDKENENKDEKKEELKAQKLELSSKIPYIVEQLQQEKINKDCENRIKELDSETRKISESIAGIRKLEHEVSQFAKFKVDEIESKINGLFSHVSFQLFETTLDGKYNEICETSLNGVKWGTINTEGKINSGLDIINTLSEYYGVSLPIFLDNRESVTNIIDTGTQTINLVVSPEDQKLRVEI